MDKIDEDNPFRQHIKTTISRKDFSPPKQVHFGFKPVKIPSDAFPIEPLLDIEDLDVLPGPPYVLDDKTIDFEDFAQIFPGERTEVSGVEDV